MPLYKNEKLTVRNYDYLREKYARLSRDFLENSAYHKQQMLGRRSHYHLSQKLPPMRSTFVARSLVLRNQSEASPLKQDPQRHRLTHFGAAQDRRGTNTLTYSETHQQTHGDSNGKGNSDQDTVFKVRELKTHIIGEEEGLDVSEDADPNLLPGSLVKSQHLETKSPKLGPDPNSQFAKSDLITDSRTKMSPEKQPVDPPKQPAGPSPLEQLQMPAFRHNWFEHLTQEHYCHLRSLQLKMDNIDYSVPFGLAKLILASYGNMQIFLHKTVFKPNGEFEFDNDFIETMIRNPFGPQEFITDELIVLNHFEVALRYPQLTRHPSIRIWSRRAKRWQSRSLTYAEVSSIDLSLSSFRLDGSQLDRDAKIETDDLYSLLSHPHMSRLVPDLGKIEREIERAEKQLQVNRSGSVDFGPKERTFVMVKPDGVQRGLVGKIVERFEQRGFKLVGMKLARPRREAFEKHYQNLKATPYFGKVVDYMLMGPVCQMVWEGDNVVAIARTMLGETRPTESAPGTIRGDFGLDVGRNACHGSDSVASADREIDLWFGREELCALTPNPMT